MISISSLFWKSSKWGLRVKKAFKRGEYFGEGVFVVIDDVQVLELSEEVFGLRVFLGGLFVLLLDLLLLDDARQNAGVLVALLLEQQVPVEVLRADEFEDQVEIRAFQVLQEHFVPVAHGVLGPEEEVLLLEGLPETDA